MKRRTSVLLSCLALGLLSGACTPDDPPPQSELPVDSSLVNILVDLRLIDARATLTNMPEKLRDSLRETTLARHNETETSLARRIEAAGEDPQALERLLEEVQTALSLERQGEEFRIAK